MSNFQKLIEKLVTGVLALGVIALLAVFVVQPQVDSMNLDGTNSEYGGVYYSISDGDNWSYVSLGISLEKHAGTVKTFNSRSYEPSSRGSVEVDRAADSAWFAAVNALGCPTPYDQVVEPNPGYADSVFAVLEGKEIAVPEGIAGYSAGLAFTLAQASYETGFSPEGSIAAVGTVRPNGSVRKVANLEPLVHAAIESGAELLLLPAANASEARSLSGESLHIVGVDTAAQALDYLDFPRLDNC